MPTGIISEIQDQMVNQRLDEWEDYDEWEGYDEIHLFYHTNQWDNPKYSTVSFYEFVKSKLECSDHVIDLGAGAGAATSFFAGKNGNVKFVAADYVQDYLDIGREMAQKRGVENLQFRQVDWFNLQETDEFDGAISLQTLSWLPEPRVALTKVFEKINPKWFALTSLFYEGDISCTIEVNEHGSNVKSFYNVYSLPEIKRIAEQSGYRVSDVEKFQIPIDIEKPSDPDIMGTYTRKLSTDKGGTERLQISGPLLMPWYMIMFERELERDVI